MRVAPRLLLVVALLLGASAVDWAQPAQVIGISPSARACLYPQPVEMTPGPAVGLKVMNCPRPGGTAEVQVAVAAPPSSPLRDVNASLQAPGTSPSSVVIDFGDVQAGTVAHADVTLAVPSTGLYGVTLVVEADALAEDGSWTREQRVDHVSLRITSSCSVMYRGADAPAPHPCLR